MKGQVTMPLGITRPPTAPGERAVSYEIYPLFTHSIVTGKYTDIFRGGEFSAGMAEIFFRENFLWVGKMPKRNGQGETVRWGNFPEFLHETLFICLTFSSIDQFYTCRCFREISKEFWFFRGRGDFPREKSFMVKFSTTETLHGGIFRIYPEGTFNGSFCGEDFPWRGRQIPSIIWKNE